MFLTFDTVADLGELVVCAGLLSLDIEALLRVPSLFAALFCRARLPEEPNFSKN